MMMIIIIIIVIIFINSNWAVTRWQWLFYMYTKYEKSPVKCVPVLSGGKVRTGRAADHSPPSSTVVMEE